MPAKVNDLEKLLADSYRLDVPLRGILAALLRARNAAMRRLLGSKYVWHTIILLLILSFACFIAATIYGDTEHPLSADFLRRQGIYFIVVGVVYGVLTYLKKL